MSQRPFPKPPPIEPLPEEVWLDRTDRAEVGREAFFCGRDAEYDVFRNVANSLRSGRIGGGTMIFQGAPGAGKTALMQECMEAVRLHSTPDEPWVAVSVHPGTLSSPIGVVMQLLDAAIEESKRLLKITSGALAQKFGKLLELGVKLYEELSERGIGIAGIAVGGKSEAGGYSDSTVSSSRIFRCAVPLLEEFHLVVFVDEAQNTPVESGTRGVLDCIHRDLQGIPLVAAFFGLSDTRQVLRKCGLSRFADERVRNLEPLSMKDTAVSFRRMLDTYYIGEEEEKADWVNALTELSQGWPQHINRIGVAAGRVIRTHEGQLGSNWLEQALEKGIERKNEYYAGRLDVGTNPPWVYKQLALTAATKQSDLAGILSLDEVAQLSEPARKQKEETIDEFVTNALHAGLLAPVINLPYHYRFPIPSLGDYLRSLPVELPKSV